MKIYTRTGDQGTTALFGGDRVDKHHPLIDAYGTVDEASSFLGLARAHLKNQPGASLLDKVLHRIQNELFVLGADLATPLQTKVMVPRITTEQITQVEEDIDRLEEDLPPLKQFILPGGTEAAATLHIVRTVCRRAERLCVAATGQTPLNENAVIYLNRLSDFFFVAARWANLQADTQETTWSS